MKRADMRILLFALGLQSAAVAAQASAATDSNSLPAYEEQAVGDENRWYDTGHSYLTNRADRAAQ